MIATKCFESPFLAELGKKIAEWQNKELIVSKGSIPFFNSSTGQYGVLCFYASDVATNNKEVSSDTGKPRAESSSQTANSSKFSKKGITERMRNKLIKLGKTEVEIADMTFEEAFKIIGESMNGK
jgi:hypothetical protein